MDKFFSMKTTLRLLSSFSSALYSFQRGKLGLVTRVKAEENPPLYYLSTLNGSHIGGTFYRQELRHLSKFDKRAKFSVKKVHRQANKNGVNYSRVTYHEIPARKFWVPTKDLEALEAQDSDSD